MPENARVPEDAPVPEDARAASPPIHGHRTTNEMKRLLSHFYGAAIALRNAGFDHRLFRIVRTGVPVISVGNITAGGSGKTPVVELLAAYLLDRQCRAAVVTRGYRRETRGNFIVSDGRGAIATARMGGDEAVQTARKFPTLAVVADEVRSRGCRLAVDRFSAETIILDDAFQHRFVHRDVDIVVVDTIEGDFDRQLLPAGRLREPLANLRRADLIILSKCEPSTPVEEITRSLAAYSAAPVFATRYVPRALRRLGGAERLRLDALHGLPLGGFCGIGMPEGFRRTLAGLQADLRSLRSFPDHHWYVADDIASLREEGRVAGVEAWITTEKDAMRLLDEEEWKYLGDVYYPEMEVEFLGEEDAFFALIEASLTGAAIVR